VQVWRFPSDRVQPAAERFPRLRIACGIPLSLGYVALFALSAAAADGQQGAAQVTPHPIVIPNRSLDSHDLNDMAERNARKRNFEAANIARKLLIDDETNRLLILARDMKKRTDQLGENPLPPVLMKEAAIIEFLANDVKQKMKLTVNVE
jgi:hypothetical protein